MRAESIRNEIIRMVRQAPFRPFVLSMENGDRVPIGHPENIAFDPEGDSPDFYVISGRVRLSAPWRRSRAWREPTRWSTWPNRLMASECLKPLC
jgi:hypothetical protein